MGKGYFSVDNLKGMGNDKFQQLESMAIDSGQSFLSGQVTNVSFKIANSKGSQALTNVATTGLGTFATMSSMISSSPEIITTLSNQIISECTKIITKEVANIGSQYLLNHTKKISSFPKDVLSYATSYFMANKGTADKEALNSLLKSAESRQEKQAEDNKSNKTSEFINKMSSNSSKFIDSINQYTSYATSYISMITSYLENGPEWISNKLDKQIGDLVDNIQTGVDKQWNEKDLPAYEEKIESLGTTLGDEMVKKYLNAVTKAQKIALEKVEKMKSKALLKVLQAKASAASKIASTTGVYVPV